MHHSIALMWCQKQCLLSWSSQPYVCFRFHLYMSFRCSGRSVWKGGITEDWEWFLQAVTWERWLQQAEGMVMLPGTQRGAYDITWQQQQEALHACKLERSIHRVTARKQHMCRVRIPSCSGCTSV